MQALRWPRLRQKGALAPVFGVKTAVFRSSHNPAAPEGRGLFKGVITDSNRKHALLTHINEFNTHSYTFITLTEEVIH